MVLERDVGTLGVEILCTDVKTRVILVNTFSNFTRRNKERYSSTALERSEKRNDCPLGGSLLRS